MTNGQDMLDEMDFEKRIEVFTESEKFLARQIFGIRKVCASRSSCSEMRVTKKQLAIGTGSVGLISIAVTIIYEVLSRLFN